MGEKCGRRINLFPRNPDDEREPVGYSACKIEAFLWLGNARYAAACWSAIPPGYEIDHGRDVDAFPKYIEYNQFSVRRRVKRSCRGHLPRCMHGECTAASVTFDFGRNQTDAPRRGRRAVNRNRDAARSLQTFQLRAHLFQGRFDPGTDAFGLLDSFVRVAFRGYTASTQVSLQRLTF